MRRGRTGPGEAPLCSLGQFWLRAELSSHRPQATGHRCVDMLQTGEGWVPREKRQDARASARPPGHSFWLTALQQGADKCVLFWH